MIKKPDFFIVGAPKSGTTALNEYLSRHPQIFMSEIKEYHMFGSDLQFKSKIDNKKRMQNYLKLFKNAVNGCRIGESSVMYLYSEYAAKEIKQFSPDGQIIIMLRNPVDMLYSHHSQLLYNDDEILTDFKEALDAEPERRKGINIPEQTLLIDFLYYCKIAQYDKQVDRYLKIFGKENVHIIIFDDFKSDTTKSFEQTLRFLGVDANFKTNFEVINPNKKAKFKSIQNFVKYPPGFLEPFKLILPDQIRWNLKNQIRKWNRKFEQRKPLDPQIRNELTKEFTPHIKSLESLIGRDLSKWLV